MKILDLHGWNSVVGGVKPTHLQSHDHDVHEPALDHQDFQAALRTAQIALEEHQPDVVMGSSRGGAVRIIMIDTYHCPRCSRLLKCEGVVSIGGYELPVFSCEDCIVRKAVFGPGTEEFELAYTFCVDSAGRAFDPVDELFEPDEGQDAGDDFGPDVSLN